MASAILTATLTACSVLIATFVSAEGAQRSGFTSSNESCSEASNKCGLYLAPSTIPGAGLGLFAGNEKHPGDIIGPGDVAIPLIDIKYHSGRKGNAIGTNRRGRLFNMFEDYQWAGKFMGMTQESDDESDIDQGVTAHVPGLDAVINCHLGLLNVGKALPMYSEGNGITRYTSPGAGAITPYFNGTTFVEEYIPAGGELFKFYGDNYFTSRENYMGLIPLRQDYAVAEETCSAWLNLNVSDVIKDDLWDSIVMFHPWESRTTNAFPQCADLARQAQAHGIRSVHQLKATRSLDELERVGRCQDNIRHGPSNLYHAGRGAFATRSLSKGAIIAGSPVLHIPDRNFTFMYAFDLVDPPGRWQRNLNKRRGSQILVNYCWGHVDSTLLLCPYGTGINFLNHNQSRANIKLQWPSPLIMSHNSTWLELSPSDMHQYTIGLALDFVALRNIEEGEELFVDYGNAWEQAWRNHLRGWTPRKKWEHYASAQVWNNKMGEIPLRTKEEQLYEPYPKHIFVRCHHCLKKDDWEEYMGVRGVQLWRTKDKGVTCDIMNRSSESGSLVYDVRVYLNNGHSAVVREYVPRSAFHFIDVPYSTDLHQDTAFRHAAQLPEEMVPTIWKNDAQNEE